MAGMKSGRYMRKWMLSSRYDANRIAVGDEDWRKLCHGGVVWRVALVYACAFCWMGAVLGT
jgi:hypothetical protein